jgi:hypothetical protein
VALGLQFCRQHAGYQGALECDETDDDDAAAAAAASQPHHPMHASRALEPTISLAEVSFLPFRLQVEVAAALEPAAASAAPQPQPFVAETPDAASPAFVSALHHGGGAGGGAATGSSSGACWSEEPGEISPRPVFPYRRVRIQGGQGRGGLGYRSTV